MGFFNKALERAWGVMSKVLWRLPPRGSCKSCVYHRRVYGNGSWDEPKGKKISQCDAKKTKDTTRVSDWVSGKVERVVGQGRVKCVNKNSGGGCLDYKPRWWRR